MCGFAGCWSNASAEIVAPLALRLRHRGPDGDGSYASWDRNIAFGHRRLAIVDLGGGDQPMANEDGTVWIGFNGEIYNHQELRRDLERAGHRYRTNSDTETLIHAYEEYGDEFVTRLNGEFSLILYDEKRGAALIARDRLGIRPLFYAAYQGRVYFGSEIKALLEIPGFSPEVNPEAFDQYLSLRYSSGEDSMLTGVRRLPPGTTLRLDVPGATPKVFWRLPTMQRPIALQDAADQLDKLLSESVRLRLMSDVPLGMYLSGGVDSAVILALMAREQGQPVRTFSIGFGLPLDETEIAAGLARQFGASHTEIRLPSNAYEALPDVVAGLDEPLGDIITLPTFFLSRAAAQHVKVILTGEGADEIFGSYVHQYALTRYSQYRRWCPRPLRSLAPIVVDRMPMGVMNRLFPYPESLGEAGRRRVSTFLRQAETGRAYLSLVELFNREQKTELLSPTWQAQATWESAYDSSAWPASQYLESVIDVDCRYWLPDYTLFKQDRLTMANSIEGRVPFLDHRLVEFVLSVPPSLKMRNGTLKYLLRHVASRYLGQARARTKKAAFYLPVRKFFGADFDTFVRDTLSESGVRRDGFFNPAAVNRLVDAGLTDGLLESKRLIALLMFTLWVRGLRSPTQRTVPIRAGVAGAQAGRR
jgi:asparagine synthase (glutamine-hydrolysing)